MRKLIILMLTGCICILPGCNNRKKQNLETEEAKSEPVNLSALYESENVLDTIIPNPGIKYKESRVTSRENPLSIIDFSKRTDATKEIDLADYYTNVRYVKLKHPLASDNAVFLGNASFSIYFEQGANLGRGLNSVVEMGGNNIIAGDQYFGYHCYDATGNYVYTIAAMNPLPEYNSKKNEVSVNITPATKMIRSFSVLDDNCLIYTVQNNKPHLQFHNINARKTYLTRPFYGGRALLLNPETFVSYVYNIRGSSPTPFMYSFDIKGDTLCAFMNHNSLVEPKNASYNNPESPDIYYYNNILTLRQAYNDTIYRMKSASVLEPAYVMNFGKQKLDLQTALYGDKSDKLIPYTWLETENFIIIIYTQNYDSPNNRNNGSVKFFYTFFDKAEKKIYQIPTQGFPEDFILKNSIEGGIPLPTNTAKCYNKMIYTGYTKKQLEMILKNKSFHTLPKNQQDKVKSLYDELTDTEMLVMILE